MYAQVVVLTNQSPDTDSYTYEIPKELEKEIKVGQLVEVPFGKRNPMGIVVSIQNRHPRESEDRILDQVENDKKVVIKPIAKTVLGHPLLLPYQVELIGWMKKYYFAPMVNCMEVVMPKLSNVKRLMASAPTDAKARPWPGRDLSKRPGLLPSQTIILVPSINKIAETLAKFPKAKNYVIYHNELTPTEKLKVWLKVLSGDVDYIFGSRSAIFTPCPNLKEIIIYDEHDGAYKDERSPYFDTLSVAQQIASLTGAELKIVDPSPKITTYFQIPNRIKIQNFPQENKILNLTQDRISGNRSPISFNLEEEITETIENDGNVFLFLNKKKEAGHLFCKNCKNNEYLQKAPEKCSKCASPDIFWNVLNVDSLSKEAQKLFPETRVNLLSEGNRLTTNDKRLKQIDIGTTFALYAQLAKKYDLVAHIQTDSLINLADFSSGEKLFAQITSLKKLLKPTGKLFLQTYNPEHPVLADAAKGDFQKFFDMELGARKALNYPPFSLLVKLTFKGKDKNKVEAEAKNFFINLKSNIPALPAGRQDLKIKLLGPYQSVFWQKQAAYHIILKYQLDSYTLSNRQKAIGELAKYLERGSKKYTVEVGTEKIQ